MSHAVLLIDDDESIREALAETLIGEGWTVISARDGLEGWERLQERQSPTAIVLDVMMPGMNGHQFIEALRQDPTHAGVPVIQISAVRQAPIPGVAAQLHKPFHVERLIHLLGTYAFSQSASNPGA